MTQTDHDDAAPAPASAAQTEPAPDPHAQPLDAGGEWQRLPARAIPLCTIDISLSLAFVFGIAESRTRSCQPIPASSSTAPGGPVSSRAAAAGASPKPIAGPLRSSRRGSKKGSGRFLIRRTR